jgi:hypothetical protein
MNGMSALVQRIAFRSASLVLISLGCASFPCAIGQSNSGSIKSFYDEALNITYFYPAAFVDAPPNSTPVDPSKCIKSALFAYSVTPVDSSSFALSTIDNTCPETLRSASELPAAPGKVAHAIYAAKACTLGNVPVKTRKKSDPVEPVTHVLCFDFTTQNGGMLTEMFSFIIQFNKAQPEPMFPGSVIRSTGVPTRR